MKFYIVKLGMQMFDLSRAYGLGGILNILSNSKSTVKDFGYYYLIENNEKINLKNIGKLSILIGKDLPWWGPFITQINIIPKKQKEIFNFFKKQKEITNLLQKYKSPNEAGLNKEKIETLYGAMDPTAFKGERKRKKLEKYTEGDSLKISKYDFILSTIGHLNFTIWKFRKERTNFTTVSILLAPTIEGINIGGIADIRSLKDGLEKSVFVHRNGTLPTLANIAVNLAKNIYEMKYEEKLFVPKFSSLIFSIISGGGPRSKPKPTNGGIYPLDFLYKIIDSTEKAGEIFDQWIDIFKKTNQPGYEDLAISLSEFITFPSKGLLEKYLKTHLRIFLSKEVKPKLYEHDIIKEVIKMSSEKLSDLFLNPAVKEFGDVLRKIIRISEDYGSLVEIEYTETPEQFKEVLWKFLRRVHTESKKYKKISGKEWIIPDENDLNELIKLIDKYGVKQVRAALIAHALVKSSKE